MEEKLKKLIELSHTLAAPELNLTILGEGNTSVSCGDGTFWVKASGSQLLTINDDGFCHVKAKPILDLLDKANVSDDEIEQVLKISLVDTKMKKPSVETFLHALCLYEAGVNWVGHTHALSVISFLCSKLGAEPFLNHIFPDAVVVCGESPAVVPYADPGLPLARAVRESLHQYMEEYGASPKLMLIQNHGMVALGMQDRDVINISLMADKWARALLGTYSVGGPRFLPREETRRIETRPDEDYRRKEISSLK